MSIKKPWEKANKRVVALAGSHAEVARILGYGDRRNVYPWTSGLRPFPEKQCVVLERVFPQVTRKQLRPHDWQEVWPELA